SIPKPFWTAPRCFASVFEPTSGFAGSPLRPRMPRTSATTIANGLAASRTIGIDPGAINPNPFSGSLYRDPDGDLDDLIPSSREHGILVALVVAPGPKPASWEILSGHRRLACALALGLAEVPCQIRRLPSGIARQHAIIEYNRQRRKTFSQLM